LPRRGHGLPEAVHDRPSRPRLLRPEGRAAGGRHPPSRSRPRARARRARGSDRSRRRRACPVVAQRAAVGCRTAARAGAPEGARGGRKRVPARRRSCRSRQGRVRRARPGVRRRGRPRRRVRPGRGRPRRRHTFDRQRRPGGRTGMSTRPRTPAASTPAPGKLPLPELAEMKRRTEKIVMVTAYDAPSGQIADAAGVDVILVGDSAAMAVMGYDSTVPATVDEMLLLTRWVARGARRPLVVGDLPFGSYQVSDEQAVATAIRFLKEGGADLVKLEGGGAMVSRVRAIVDAGIGVVAHIGLTPQSATVLGGFRAQGRTAARALRLID